MKDIHENSRDPYSNDAIDEHHRFDDEKVNPRFKYCGKCARLTIDDDLDDHDLCIDCAQIILNEEIHASVVQEQCETCNGHIGMENTECYTRCDEYKRVFEETRREWESK